MDPDFARKYRHYCLDQPHRKMARTVKSEEYEVRLALFEKTAYNGENEQVVQAVPKPPKTLESFIGEEPAFRLTKCIRYEQNHLEPDERRLVTDNYKESDCWCGRAMASHPIEAFSDQAKRGPRSIEVPCDSYGTMCFDDPMRQTEVQGATARYVRLGGRTDDASLEKVCELLMSNDYWGIDPPQLIIEVAGGASEFAGVNERLIEKFNHALIKAAESGDAWLITAGFNAGVMKLVGDAVAKARRLNIPLTCLGITPWGAIDYRETLEKTTQETVKYPITDSRTPVSLNYGHNFYLLVDNGVEERYGEEIAFRAALMHYISERAQFYEEKNKERSRSQSLNKQQEKGNSSSPQPGHQMLKIPRILLVAGGGAKTLRMCKLAVKGTPEHPDAVSPIVVLAGFGGASELIAHANYLQNRTRKKKEEADGDDPAPPEFFDEMCKHPLFTSFAKLPSGKTPEQEAKKEAKKWEFVNDLYSCVQDPKMITVVDLRNPREITLDKAILNAIFKAEIFKGEACYRMLDLARRWDMANVAKDIIEKYHVNMKTMEQSRMEELFSLAIVCGQSEFYELFTDYKLVYPDTFLTQQRIEELYLKLISKIDETEEEARKPKKLQLVRCIQLFAVMLAKRSLKAGRCIVSLRSVGGLLANVMGCYLSNPFVLLPDSLASKMLVKHNVYVWGCRDLFMMQIILNQDKFAMNLWRDGRDHIGTALIASIFLHELSQRAHFHDVVNLVEPFQKQSEVWLSRAIDVVTRCNEARPERVQHLLTRVLPSWQNRTVLEMAFYGKRRAFTQHPAVLSKLNQIWHGKIASFEPSLKIYLTAICPILIFWLSFEINKKKKEKSEDEAEDAIEFRAGTGGDTQIRPISAQNLYAKDTVAVQPSLAFCKLPQNRLSLPRAIYYLYSSPKIKFFFHTTALTAFLLLFSSFILTTSLNPEGATKTEIIILAWSFCLLCDGIHETFVLDFEMFMEDNSSDKSAFGTETWRRMRHGCYNAILFDILAEFILVISFLLRHTLSTEQFVYPQTMYAIACLLFWLKSFRIFYLSESVGILVVTLGKILPILLQFLLLYIVLIATYAPPLFALANPQFTSVNMEDPREFLPLFLDVIYRRWWNLVGVAIDTTRARIEETCPVSYASRVNPQPTLLISGNSSLHIGEITPQASKMDEPGIQRCESGGSILGRNFVAAILFVSYLWLTNITWLNMLIASLNRAVEVTRASAIEYWSFNYYIAVRTWYHRSVLAAPLSLLELILRFLIFACRGKKKGRKRSTRMRKYYDAEIENLRFDELERSAVDQMLDEEEHKRQK